MHQEIVNLWNRPISSLPTYIDLGRLCKRIDVYAFQDGLTATSEGAAAAAVVDSELGDVPLLDQSITLDFQKPLNQRSDHRARDLANAIEVVASKLEPPGVMEKLPTAVDEFINDAGDNLDYRVYIQKLFTIFDLENSPSVKIFKLVNQAALFIAIMEMKTLITAVSTPLKPDELMTKDVRTADGWRVEIKITPSEISVAHVRKDQCLGPPLCPDHWDVQWRFCVTFARDMSQITRSSLEVLNMTFGPKIPSQLSSELKRVYYEAINKDFSFSDSTRVKKEKNFMSVTCCC